MVLLAVENLEGVFPFVLLSGLADLQPGHLLAPSGPHVLTRRDLRVSLGGKIKNERDTFQSESQGPRRTPVGLGARSDLPPIGFLGISNSLPPSGAQI